MSLLVVRTFTDPVLRKRSQSIEKVTEDIQELVKDMVETMYFYKGIGLAAPQIGVSQKLITIDISQDNESLNPQVFINPEIIKSKGSAEYSEGCLSIPNFNGDVIRSEQVTVKFISLEGEEKIYPVKGLLARVLQHEIDHLHGILFTDYLDERWWNSEEGQKMLSEHPRFSEETKNRVKNKKKSKI